MHQWTSSSPPTSAPCCHPFESHAPLTKTPGPTFLDQNAKNIPFSKSAFPKECSKNANPQDILQGKDSMIREAEGMPFMCPLTYTTHIRTTRRWEVQW